LSFGVDAGDMETPRKLTLVPAPEPLAIVPDEVRLTGEAARRAERANLLALEAAIEAARAG
jgi:hypothetical protein